MGLFKILAISILLLILNSCSKGEKNDFDKQIKFAYDFGVDPVTNDTVYRFAIPNGFTPNGDGINDYFFANTIGVKRGNFKMTIVDRSGDVIFTTIDQYKSWNGNKYSSKVICQMGVYNIDISLTDTLGNPHRYLNYIQMFR